MTKNTSWYLLTENPKDRSVGPPNIALKLEVITPGFFLSRAFILSLHFVSRFQTRSIPQDGYMSITRWNVERVLMFSLGGFRITFSEIAARGRTTRESRLPSAPAASLIIIIRDSSLNPILFAKDGWRALGHQRKENATVEKTNARQNNTHTNQGVFSVRRGNVCIPVSS